MATARKYRGTQFSRTLRVDPDTSAEDIDLATTALTVIHDDSAGTRVVYRWRPGGSSSSRFTYTAATATAVATLRLTLTSTDTSTVAVGSSLFGWFYDTAAVAQKALGTEEVVFEDMPDGVIPVVDP